MLLLLLMRQLWRQRRNDGNERQVDVLEGRLTTEEQCMEEEEMSCVCVFYSRIFCANADKASH